MILSYQDRADKKKRHRINAKLVVSSKGAPLIILDNGEVLNFLAWFSEGYDLESSTISEKIELHNMGLVSS